VLEGGLASEHCCEEAVQLNDQEMDTISAAGLGKAIAPGQLIKRERLLASKPANPLKLS
jgi:hypothetical protein